MPRMFETLKANASKSKGRNNLTALLLQEIETSDARMSLGPHLERCALRAR